MQKPITFKIGDSSYTLKFGYSAMRLLGRFLDVDTYDGTAAKISTAIALLGNQEKEGGSLPFETLEVLGYMILASIAEEDADLDLSTVIDALFVDMDQLKTIIEGWADAMPKPKQAAKKKQANKKK